MAGPNQIAPFGPNGSKIEYPSHMRPQDIYANQLRIFFIQQSGLPVTPRLPEEIIFSRFFESCPFKMSAALIIGKKIILKFVKSTFINSMYIVESHFLFELLTGETFYER